MESTLQLIFRNAEGRQYSLTVPRPRPDLTEAEVTGGESGGQGYLT